MECPTGIQPVERFGRHTYSAFFQAESKAWSLCHPLKGNLRRYLVLIKLLSQTRSLPLFTARCLPRNSGHAPTFAGFRKHDSTFTIEFATSALSRAPAIALIANGIRGEGSNCIINRNDFFSAGEKCPLSSIERPYF